MKVIRDRRFSRTRVVLDDHHFINCTFVDCTVAYSGGECFIDETLFVRPRLELSGAAANTAYVLRALNALNPKMFRFEE